MKDRILHTVEEPADLSHTAGVERKHHQKRRRRVTAAWLRKIGVPTALVAGVILAVSVGVENLQKLGPDYRKSAVVFPSVGKVTEVLDGDTFRLRNGLDYRLVSIDAPNRGEKGNVEATEALQSLAGGKKVWLEYDRYQNDRFGRILVWVWVGCEGKPTFLPPDYMHLSASQSREGLTENPEGCNKGRLVQEELVRKSHATVINYGDQGPSKYEARLERVGRL